MHKNTHFETKKLKTFLGKGTDPSRMGMETHLHTPYILPPYFPCLRRLHS